MLILCSCLSVQVKWMTLGWTFPFKIRGLIHTAESVCRKLFDTQRDATKNQNVTFNSDELAFVWGCDQDRLQTLSHFLPLCSVQNVFRLFGSMLFHYRLTCSPSGYSIGDWRRVLIIEYTKGFLRSYCPARFLYLMMAKDCRAEIVAFSFQKLNKGEKNDLIHSAETISPLN